MSLTLTPRTPGSLTTNGLSPGSLTVSGRSSGSLTLLPNPPGLIWSDAMFMSDAFLIDNGAGVIPTVPLVSLSPGTLVLA